MTTAIWLLENMSHRKHDSSKSIFANFIEKNFSSKSTNFYTCHRIFSIFYTCHRIFLFHKTCHRKILFYQTLHRIKKNLISYDPWYCLTDRSLNPWSWKLSFRPLFYRWSFRPLVLFYWWSFRPLVLFYNGALGHWSCFNDGALDPWSCFTDGALNHCKYIVI